MSKDLFWNHNYGPSSNLLYFILKFNLFILFNKHTSELYNQKQIIIIIQY